MKNNTIDLSKKSGESFCGVELSYLESLYIHNYAIPEIQKEKNICTVSKYDLIHFLFKEVMTDKSKAKESEKE